MVMRELTEKDFDRGVRNPHFDRLMTKIEVAIKKDDWNTFCELSKLNGIPPEIIMRNCLSDFANEIREDE